MGSVNGIVGDDGGVANGGQAPMPQATADDTQLKELKAAAKFATGKEYKELKSHFEKRMDFYKQYLPNGSAVGANGVTVGPDGRPVGDGMTLEEIGRMWVLANVINGELRAIINVYDNAAEMLKEYTEGNETS